MATSPHFEIQLPKADKKYWSAYRKINPLYHNFYTEKTGVFDPRYVPDDVYYNDINMYLNAHAKAKVVDNKCYYDVLFPDVPQPKILARRKAGMWYVGKEMVGEEKMFAALANEKEVFVKKATESAGGSGVSCIQIASNNSFREDIKTLAESCNVDLVIQSALKQHESLAKFNANSVNTMRLLTVLFDGEVRMYSAVLRIGGGKGRVDNFSSGGVTVGIDENGNLKKLGFNSKGERFESHPLSGTTFEGCHLPAFAAAKEMVKKHIGICLILE